MTSFYFKSPDYNLTGNIKVTVDNIQIESIRMAQWGELHKFPVYSMDVSINGNRKRISRIVGIETYDLCEFSIGRDINITVDITEDHRCQCSMQWNGSDMDLVELTQDQYSEAKVSNQPTNK